MGQDCFLIWIYVCNYIISEWWDGVLIYLFWAGLQFGWVAWWGVWGFSGDFDILVCRMPIFDGMFCRLVGGYYRVSDGTYIQKTIISSLN